MRLWFKRLSTFQIIILGFALVILAGALLLMLPAAANSRAATPFLEALFTSTSAVCVTGLVIHDTVTYWSAFGQAVILLLIQVGGLGVVTIAGAIMMMSGRRIPKVNWTSSRGSVRRANTIHAPAAASCPEASPACVISP